MPEDKLPFSAEVELRLLAAFVRNPEVYYQLSDIVSRKVFVHHKESFEKYVKSLETERINDLPRLGDITQSTDPESDAKYLLSQYKTRLIKLMLEKASEKLFSEADSTEKVLNFLADAAKKIEQSARANLPVRDASLASQMPSILNLAKSKQVAAKENGGLVGLPTSFPTLDRLLGGLQPGLHLLSAQPGAGKTTLALQIARKNAEKGFPAIFLTYEQSPALLGLKMICSRYSLSSKPYMDGFGDIAILEEKFSEAKATGWPDRLYVIEGSAKTSVPYLKAFVSSVLVKHKAKHGLIIIDYLQRWARELPSKRDFRFDVSSLSSDLRTLSESLSCPLIAISSQNRGAKEEASMHRLRESGDLEYDGDSIMFITGQQSNGISEERHLTLSLVKNRFGNSGEVNLSFRPTTGVLYELANR